MRCLSSSLRPAGNDSWFIFIVNVFSVVPKGKVKEVAAMLKASTNTDDFPTP